MSAEFTHCEKCGAWETKEYNSIQGECRRRAPIVVDSEWKGIWPIVKNIDGCCESIEQRTTDEF